MRLISLLLFIFIVVLGGCTTIQPVSRVDVMELDALNRQLRGRTIGIEFANGERQRGRLEFVRMDSLAWQSAGVRHVVPIDHVDRLISDNRLRSTRDGFLIGTAVGVLLAIMARNSSDPFIPFFETIMTPTGIIYGATIGAIVGRKRVYQLQDYAPWHFRENEESELPDS